MPEDFRVLASERNCRQVVGGEIPAVLNAWTLYQTVDLFDALNTTPYNLPLIVPSFTQAGPKFALYDESAYVSGFSAPVFANCLINPGWAMSARSGG